MDVFFRASYFSLALPHPGLCAIPALFRACFLREKIVKRLREGIMRETPPVVGSTRFLRFTEMSELLAGLCPGGE